MRRPAVELSLCSVCLGCVDVCPEVFRLTSSGYIEVVDLSEYPEFAIDEAIKYCPEDCIYWEEE